MFSFLGVFALLCFASFSQASVCDCVCRVGGVLHTYQNTTTDCGSCDKDFCAQYGTGCSLANEVTTTCGVKSAWAGEWTIPANSSCTQNAACCCMSNTMTVSDTNTAGTYHFVVGVTGNCGGAQNFTGNIVEINNQTDSVAYLKFLGGADYYITNVGSIIQFNSISAANQCSPPPLTCSSGDCKPFPTGVIIAVVVIIVIVLGVGIAVFLWYRKRSSYQSL
eukprot:TRINITY_DN13295_c0_g1_i1.p1 TRINITY_DN13295_c0_g1~~TRINITY_DN13295_c0_g1_i1.p1  ORF type:complete len:221 (+),score=46.57 TRINITY_DN13295_c0_g1_i1:78-740(+)